jgi:hyperosmotically inducible periplasmic protein
MSGLWVRTVGAAAMAVLLGVGAAAADTGRDEMIRDAAADAILGYPYYGVFDSVDLGVENGVVVLQGSVRQPWRKVEIEKRVARVDGVREVRNEIRVQPVSFNDDRLRAELYRRIYGTVLERFASSAYQPVHIVVENGNVTLTGVVNSRVEKVQLETIARSTLSFAVDNRVQVESD